MKRASAPVVSDCPHVWQMNELTLIQTKFHSSFKESAASNWREFDSLAAKSVVRKLYVTVHPFYYLKQIQTLSDLSNHSIGTLWKAFQEKIFKQ